MGCFPLTAMYAISIAIYMGYETISIVGFDHSNFKNIKVNEKNLLAEGMDYFNSYETKYINLPSHIYENISDYLLEYSIIFQQYHKYSKYKIYNLNFNGYLDAFIKSDIFSILK